MKRGESVMNDWLKQRDKTIIRQADEIAQLRAELTAIKPDWNDAPDGAKWVAMSSDGGWGWYKEKPTLFVNSGDRYQPDGWDIKTLECTFYDMYLDNWQNTLEHRPKVTP